MNTMTTTSATTLRTINDILNEEKVLLVNVQEANEPLNLDWFIITRGNANDGKVGRYLRKAIERGKRLGYKWRSGFDEYDRMYDTLERDGRIVRYIICTEEVARKTLLIM